MAIKAITPRITFMNDVPSPDDIREARLSAKLSMQEAGNLVYVSKAQWSYWESKSNSNSNRQMHPAVAELFGLKTGLIKLEDVAPELVKMQKLKAKVENSWFLRLWNFQDQLENSWLNSLCDFSDQLWQGNQVSESSHTLVSAY